MAKVVCSCSLMIGIKYRKIESRGGGKDSGLGLNWVERSVAIATPLISYLMSVTMQVNYLMTIYCHAIFAQLTYFKTVLNGEIFGLVHQC